VTVRFRPRRLEPWLAGAALLVLGRAFASLFVGAKDGTPALLPGGDAAWLVVQLAALATVLALAASRARGVARVLTRDVGPLALVLFAVASMAWSVAPWATAREGAVMAAGLLFGAYLASTFDVPSLARFLGGVLIVAAVASAVVAVAVPGVGVATGSHAGSWTGVFDHKNTLGMVMSLGLVVAPVLWWARPPGRMPWLALAVGASTLGVLAASRSKTTLAIAVALLVLAPAIARLRGRALESATVAALVALIAAVVIAATPLYAEAALEEINPRGTIQERLRLWSALAGDVSARPWTGYGLDAYWQNGGGPDADVARAFPWGPNHAHNGPIELLLELGWLGAALAFAHLLLFVARALRSVRSTRTSLAEAAWPLLFLTWYLLSNVTYSNFAGQSTLHWILYATVAFQVSRRSLLFRRAPVAPEAKALDERRSTRPATEAGA